MYYLYYNKEDNRLKNYYKLLGIPRDIDDATLHKHFADLHQSGKTNELIEEAYAILSNPEECARYNRVYDRYNWDYGIQKNSLYEKSKPKKRGRVLFLILLFILIGFSAIAFFFRSPEATTPSTTMEEPANKQIAVVVTTDANVSGESDQIDTSDQTKPTTETSSESSETNTPVSDDSEQALVALSVSDEMLAKYPTIKIYDHLDNLYPKAQVTAGVNFRNAPTMDSAVLSSVSTTETFRVMGKVGGWSYVYRETEGYGWIGGKYIRFTE